MAKSALLVEDDAAIATVITAALEEEGFVVARSDSVAGRDRLLADHIFEPFVTSKSNGQGLGLALVRKLVRDMDGRITHERDESAGQTHFRVHLPMAR